MPYPNKRMILKDPVEVKNGVKTRSRTKNEPTVNFKGFDWYHIQKEFISRWVLGKEQKK